jgi:hypothetical protein
VTSIERTAYPRFKRFLSARELHVFYTPQPEEIAWARGQARSDEHGEPGTGHRPPRGLFS